MSPLLVMSYCFAAMRTGLMLTCDVDVPKACMQQPITERTW